MDPDPGGQKVRNRNRIRFLPKPYLGLGLGELPDNRIVGGGHGVEYPVNALQTALRLHIHPKNKSIR